MRPVREVQFPDRARFLEIVQAGRPALFRGLCADWRGVQCAREGEESLAAWLRSAATAEAAEAWFGEPEIGGRFGYDGDLTGYNHDRRLATVDQLLDLLLRQRGHPSPYSIYAGAMPVRRHLPGLMPELRLPVIEVTGDMLVSLWLGNRTRTAVHWDLPQNLACVVAGRRRFTLFPPEQVGNLYVGPLDFTLAGQPSSLVDIDAPDLERFPRYREAAAAAETAELGPGDALYIPSLWWHGVASLDEVAAMVNFWWRDGAPPLLTPLNALYHAAITVKDLPPHERAAWRAHFDHYIFGDDGDPAAHLPEAARGILGRRTPELVARVRALLARALSR